MLHDDGDRVSKAYAALRRSQGMSPEADGHEAAEDTAIEHIGQLIAQASAALEQAKQLLEDMRGQQSGEEAASPEGPEGPEPTGAPSAQGQP